VTGSLPITGNEDGWDSGHLHYFTFGSLKKLFNKYGFKLTHSGSSGIFAAFRNVWPSLLGGDIILKGVKI